MDMSHMCPSWMCPLAPLQPSTTAMCVESLPGTDPAVVTYAEGVEFRKVGVYKNVGRVPGRKPVGLGGEASWSTAVLCWWGAESCGRGVTWQQ